MTRHPAAAGGPETVTLLRRPALVTTVLFCAAFLAWSGDLALLGAAGILGGALGLFELVLIARWEREHDARLALVARTREERWRLFVWNRRYVAIGRSPSTG